MSTLPSFDKILIVSPHLDDAALSCFALLGDVEPPDVLTVFAGEPDPPQHAFWDRMCGFEDSSQGMRARWDEERAALERHRLEFLPLLEAQYSAGRDEAQAGLVTSHIRSWCSKTEGSVALALPAGAGVGRVSARVLSRLRHPKGRRRLPPRQDDHLFVRDLGVAAAADLPRTTILLYEELPYLFGGDAAAATSRLARRWGLERTLCAVPVDRTKKALLISHYRSQVPYLYAPVGRLDQADALPAAERYWILRRTH